MLGVLQIEPYNFKLVSIKKELLQMGLDVLTRWNSTYLMLETVLKYQKAFERLKEQRTQFSCKLALGPPTDKDWNNARVLVRFLKRFYDATN